MRRTRRIEETGSGDRWLVSYADFITLLFAFFVVMYAISSVDAQKWDRVSIGMKAAFTDPDAGNDPIVPIMTQTGGAVGNRSGARSGNQAGSGAAAWELQLLQDHIESGLNERGIAGDEASDPVRVAATPRGLSIVFDANTLFGSSGVNIKANAIPLLAGIAESLATSNAQVRIEAHTGSKPRLGGRYTSDWELSSAMAASVSRYLIDHHRIRPERIGIAGFGSMRPLDAKQSNAGGQDRRIEIAVLSVDTAVDEPDAAARDEALRGLLDQLEPVRDE